MGPIDIHYACGENDSEARGEIRRQYTWQRTRRTGASPSLDSGTITNITIYSCIL